MKGRIIGVLFCLLFAIPFGGVGLWATWSFASTLREAWSARDWVLVRADVMAAELVVSSGKSRSLRATGTYRYHFEGREYTGARLSITGMDGADNVGDWQKETAEFLLSAKKEKRPVEVYVNPANPSQAVLDRNIRWPLMLFYVPFGVIFGVVGLVALFGAWFIATKPAEGTPRALERARAKRLRTLTLGSQSSVWQIWGFAILWSAIAFPIAVLAMPQIIERGNWFGYLILLFPLVGVLLLWAAIASTWTEIRKRRSGGSASPPPSGQHKFATGRPASFYEPDSAPDKKGSDPFSAEKGSDPFLSGAPDVAIPPEVADIEERGGIMTVRYPGGLFASLFGRLTVVAGGGELRVEKKGIFGRKEYRAAQSSITDIAPSLLYSVRSGARMTHYYVLRATTRDGERIPLAPGLPGTEVANAMAMQIARALKLSPDHVTPVEAKP